MYNKVMNYQDIVVVEDLEEAEQFRYDHNNQVVEVGTPVAYEHHDSTTNRVTMTCFKGIYFQSDE
jgi:hypothetical protein